jgi:NAD(P)H-dependent FMN reductase
VGNYPLQTPPLTEIGDSTMRLLVLNGSPRTNGTVATLLRAVVEGVGNRHQVEWIDVYGLKMRPCTACMKCRPDGQCCLPEDDAHSIARKIRQTDALIVGTPTHWGNMSAQLKVLFDRIVPALIGERPNGLPIPRHKGRPAVIVTACTAPWPFNFLLGESRGAVRAVKKILDYGGYRTQAVLVQPGTRRRPLPSERLIARAKQVGRNL